MEPHISLSLLPVFPGCLDRRHTLPTLTQGMEISVCNNLSFYEAAFEIVVNRSSSLWCQATSLDRPTSDLLLTG